MRRLEGKCAIITGTNRGIGKETMLSFAREGADIFACARSNTSDFEALLKEIQEQYQVEITPVFFDLMNEEEIKRGIKEIFDTGKQIDILVNNAGVAYGATFQMTPMSKLKEVFQINYFAQVYITQLVAKKMIRQKAGAIVNIASIGGVEAEEGYLAYGSSKAALIWETRCLAKELGHYGIRVNAVAPGLTETNMGHYKSEEELEKVIGRTALHRMSEPSEIVNAVLYLASEESSFVTGQVLKVDGGRCI